MLEQKRMMNQEAIEQYISDELEGAEYEEAINPMFEVLKGCQETALGLTQLIVEKCDIKELTEDKVLSIFRKTSEEALQTFTDSMTAISGEE